MRTYFLRFLIIGLMTTSLTSCIKKEAYVFDVLLIDSFDGTSIKAMEIIADDCSRFSTGIIYSAKTNDMGVARLTVDAYDEETCINITANPNMNYPVQASSDMAFPQGFVYAPASISADLEMINGDIVLTLNRVPVFDAGGSY